jgi:phosphotriesterase-related protein
MEVRRRDFLASLLAPPPASTLVHEHVLVDFIGANQVSRSRYDPEEVFRLALPHLQAVARLGCRRMLECTPNFLGRDPKLLRRLSEASGVELWTNTGLYAAREFIFLPDYAKTESAAKLARRFIREHERGVEGTKPRFIKLGVDRGPLPPLSRKLVEAAAITSRETGLPLASHTGDGVAALEQLEILSKAKCPLTRFVWVHAQNERDPEVHAKAARAGAWVEFDGIGPRSAEYHLRCVKAMAERDLLGRTLISQDSGWYHVGEPNGGNFRGYTYLYTDFLPMLPEGWAQRLLVDNPGLAFGARA